MVRRVGSRGPGQPVRQGARFPGTLPAPLPPSLPASPPPGWEEEAAGCKHTSGPLNPACTFPANLCSPAKIAPGSTGRWHSNINGAPGPPSKCHFPEKCTEPPLPLPIPRDSAGKRTWPHGPLPAPSPRPRAGQCRAPERRRPRTQTSRCRTLSLQQPNAVPGLAPSPAHGPVRSPRSLGRRCPHHAAEETGSQNHRDEDSGAPRPLRRLPHRPLGCEGRCHVTSGQEH